VAYQVKKQQLAPRPIAVVRLRANKHQLAGVIPQTCGEVWKFIQAAKIEHAGRHVAVYLDDQINIECGAEVPGPFQGDGRVVYSTTPGGRVATTAHIGPYQRLGDAHTAIRKWCADHNVPLAGPNWEIYGHWTDDPTQLRTDVFYLLQDTAAAPE
jgi:effector-binding domain-containing protein